MSLSWQCLPEAPSSEWVTHQTEVPKPWLVHKEGAPHHRGAIMLHAASLVPRAVLDQACQLVETSLQFDGDDDSVDGLPTFECRWVAEGQYTHPGLADIFRPTIEQRLVPWLRRSKLAAQIHGYNEDNLVLCEALVRMYEEGSRCVHPAHYDGDALVTAVFELPMGTRHSHVEGGVGDGRSSGSGSGSSGGEHDRRAGGFQGAGFYVQPGAHVSTRLPIRLTPGDVVAHSFDLQHGVEVSGGRRCSVILWFTNSVSSCRDRTRPWYESAAAQGHPDAQYNLGRALDRAGSDPRRAMALLRSAAQQGSFVAMNDLGGMLMAGRGCPDAVPDLAEAETWLRRAAAQGFHRSMVGLARLHAQKGEDEEAIRWLSQAAEQRAEPEVCFKLGMAHLHGLSGTTVDAARGEKWLREAAEMGHPTAQAELGMRALQRCRAAEQAGRSAAAEAEARTRRSQADEAESWLVRASRQGQLGAARALLGLYAARGDALSALQLVRAQARLRLRLSSKFSWRAELELAATLLAVPMLLFGGAAALR